MHTYTRGQESLLSKQAHNNIMGITMFARTKEEEKSYQSHALVNDPDAYTRLGVRDYTKHPQTFFEDLPEIMTLESPRFVRVEGIVTSLDMKEMGIKDNSLWYEGFLAISENALFFKGYRSKEEIGDLDLEKLMLESAKNLPITITGQMGWDNSHPYILFPEVLQMGEYISPVPTKKQ